MIGALAALLTLNYVRGVESDNAAKNQLVDVLVASGPIPAGASADDAVAMKAIVAAKRRRADLPANVITRTAEISGQISSLELGGGEVLTTAMFVSPEQRTGSNASVLDKGNVAMTIQVDTASGVADLIRVGDSVNIMARASVDGGGAPAGDPEAAGPAAEGLRTSNGDTWQTGTPYVTVLQKVKVLAINNIVDAPKAAAPAENAEDGAPAPQQSANGLITVQLPPDQAQLLASVQSAGLYLTLNRPDYEPAPIPFTWEFPAFSGQRGVTPYPTAAKEAAGQ